MKVEMMFGELLESEKGRRWWPSGGQGSSEVRRIRGGMGATVGFGALLDGEEEKENDEREKMEIRKGMHI